MSFFHLRTPVGCDWPPLPSGRHAPLWAAYLTLDRTQWLSPQQIEQQQLTQVRALLRHCLCHVPYYRQRFTEAGIQPEQIASLADFRRVPLLSRQMYQEQGPAMVTERLPLGTTATGEIRTSGTSGLPVRVLQTDVVNLWWTAFSLRDLEWSGMDPRGTLASLRSPSGIAPERRARLLQGISVPGWGSSIDTFLQTGPSHLMDLHQEPRRQLEWLRQLQPTYLLSYPSNLEFLATLVGETGGPLPTLRLIQAVSESLTPEAQARIEAAFQAPVKNLYSCTEVGYVASPCPQRHGVHVHAENVLVEVLDEQGLPCRPGETGQIVLTGLNNFRSPFIRYQILDDATVGPERCPCGRGLPLLARVHGRQRPLLRLPNGRVKNSVLLLARIKKFEEIRQYQVVQRGLDHVIVRLVPCGAWSADHEGRLRTVIEEFFESPVRLQVETLSRLTLAPGGKIQDIVVSPG